MCDYATHHVVLRSPGAAVVPGCFTRALEIIDGLLRDSKRALERWNNTVGNDNNHTRSDTIRTAAATRMSVPYLYRLELRRRRRMPLIELGRLLPDLHHHATTLPPVTYSALPSLGCHCSDCSLVRHSICVFSSQHPPLSCRRSRRRHATQIPFPTNGSEEHPTGTDLVGNRLQLLSQLLRTALLFLHLLCEMLLR